MSYTTELDQKWENENGKTSHMKVLMVHDAAECMKECTATVPCVAFTFIPGMEICALKAPKDAATMVPASGRTISGRLDGERPSVQGKELDSTICLSCLPGFSVNFFIVIILSFRVQRGGGNKVFWLQCLPTCCRDPGGLCSCLPSRARMSFLDSQPQYW